NVRQLYHGVEAAVLAATGSVIELRDFPEAVLGRSAAPPDDERAALLEALRRARGNRTHAARALGIARNTLRARLRACGITQRDIDQAIADLTTCPVPVRPVPGFVPSRHGTARPERLPKSNSSTSLRSTPLHSHGRGTVRALRRGARTE